jgi:hypothetical protein
MAVQTLSDQKIEIIVEISKLKKRESVQQVREFVKHLEKSPTKKQLEMIKKLAKPIKKKLDLQEIIREQNWKPSTKEEIDEIVKGFDWDISDEEFIEELKNI